MPDIPHSYYRISIKGLITDDKGRFLLVKEDNGLWELPGGGLEYDETPQECLKREIHEEMGLTVIRVADNPTYFYQSTSPNHPHIANVVYEITVSHLNFTPSEECVEIRFVTTEEAKKLKIYPNIQVFTRLFNPALHTA